MQRHTYAFIYDDFLNDRKYERLLADLEARLASLDLVGRGARLALFRSAKDIVESMAHQGVSTVVLIGNDQTLDKVMWFLPDLDVTLGYLPIEEPSTVAQALGIPVGLGACDVLAARLIETLDVGKLDDRYFLTEVRVPQTIAAVDIDGAYRISPSNGGTISIRNLGVAGEAGPSADAKDGLLEVVVTPQGGTSRRREKAPVPTRVLMRSGELISTDPTEIYADNHVMNGRCFHLGIEPKKLRIITGRNRRLASVPQGLPKAVSAGTLPTATMRTAHRVPRNGW